VPRAARPVFGAAPVESFTVVMATGIVAVAAREDEHPVVALALAVLAGGGLVVVVAWAALARAGRGRSGARCLGRRRCRDRRARGGGRLLNGRDGLDPGAGCRGMAQGPPAGGSASSARWSTVFPLGMYVVACATVADATSFTGLRGVSAALYWVALAAWCLTTVGALSRVVKPHG